MTSALLASAAMILLVTTTTLVRVIQLGDQVGALRERVSRLEGGRRRRPQQA